MLVFLLGLEEIRNSVIECLQLLVGVWRQPRQLAYPEEVSDCVILYCFYRVDTKITDQYTLNKLSYNPLKSLESQNPDIRSAKEVVRFLKEKKSHMG